MWPISEATCSFLEVFKPRVDRYILWDEKAVPDKHGKKWRDRKKLTDEIIEMAQQGQETIAFMCRTELDYFGLDIDDHDDGGWFGPETPTNVLISKYEEAVRLVGCKPCALFKSPHGIHTFWFFDKPLPVRILRDIIEGRVGKAAEFLPQYRMGLRIPTLMNCIDEGFAPKRISSFHEIGRYPYKDIFKEEAESVEIRKRLKKSSLAIPMKKPFDREKQIEQVERDCPRFKNGESNESYCRLVGCYFGTGLSEEEATERIIAFANSSPGYYGDLKNRGGAEARVKQSYDHLHRPDELDLQAAYISRDSTMRAYIAKIIALMGITNKASRRRRIENFLIKLKAWIGFIDKISDDYERKAYWTYLYPGFAKYLKEGYIPIPSNQLKEWNSHYNDFISDLEKNGVLTESPYNYSTHGRCKYYKVSEELRMIKIATGSVSSQ